MKKKVNRFISTLLIIIFIMPLTVFASTGEYNPKDIATWDQNKCPEAGEYYGNKENTIGWSTCGYWATAAALVKAGYLDPQKEETGVTVVRKADQIGATEFGWHFNDRKIGEFSNGDLELVDHMQYFGTTDYATTEAILKGKYEEGLYIKLDVDQNGKKGHYIFVDGWDEEGNIVFVDSAYPGNKWENYYGPNGFYMKYFTTYRSKSGKKCNEQPSVFDGVNLAESGEVQTEEEKEIYQAILDEWELEGMPPKQKISELQVMIPDVVELSTAEKKVVENQKLNIEANKTNALDVIQIVINIIAFFIMFYGVLFVACFFLDMFSIFDISSVKFITLGRLQYSGEEFGKKKGYIYIGGMLKIVISCMTLGLLLVSGLLPKLMYNFVYFIINLFN